MKHILRFTLITALLFTLTACGFKLRGNSVLPKQLQTISLQSDNPYGPFSKLLRQELSAAKVNITNSPQAAQFTLRILNEAESSTPAFVSGSTNVKQDVLSLSVKYAIYNKKGKLVVGPHVIKTQQMITVDTTQMFGASSETDETRQSLRENAITLLMDQLNSPMTQKALEKGAVAH